jgi:predicted metalloprotease with PDZ domain
MTEALHYRIVASDPAAHVFTVTLTIPDPDSAGQVVRMPTWIPGSYLIREFARNVVRLSARDAGGALAATKIAKDAWQLAPAAGPVVIEYEVYAWDLSVRAAHLDATHAFFNGPAVFLYAEGREHRPCDLELVRPRGEAFSDWRVATSLPPLDAPDFGFGTYRARDYDELIDHPVEMSDFTLLQFQAGGARHDIVLSGRHNADRGRLERDLARMCQWQIDLFGGAPGSKAPFDRYTFIVLVVGEGYGGLEHRASTTLLCARDTLPATGREKVDDDYLTFLGLASHEYFHSWNVKRIKPAAFVPYDLTRESYTRLLWAFEGFTSYYDDLALVRSGLISPERYLEVLGRNITNVLRGSGRGKQSVAESSFDAWIKYYRQDENAPNAIVSYYQKGALVGLALDLLLRRDSATTLDDVMRALWQRYGSGDAGVPEDGLERVAQEVSGLDLSGFFGRYVHGTQDPPLEDLFASFGIGLRLRPRTSQSDKGGKPPGKDDAAKPYLGARLAANEPRITQVYDGGAAQQAGLSAGDLLLAMDGLRIGTSFESQLARVEPGTSVKIHAFRRDELMTFDLPVLPAPADTCWLDLDSAADAAALARRTKWMQDGAAA